MHSQGRGNLPAARRRKIHGADWHENLAAGGKEHVPGEGRVCPDEGDRCDQVKRPTSRERVNCLELNKFIIIKYLN